MHYYKFNISDYKAHTEHLELLEDLAFRRMLDWMYLHEKPLPKEVNEIARFIRMRTHCDCITNVLHEYFTKTKDGFINERVGKELGKYQEKSEKAKKSAQARWKKNPSKNNDLVDANALQTQCDSDANGMLNTKHKTLNTKQETVNNKQELITQEQKPKRKVFTKPTIDEIYNHFFLKTADHNYSKTESETFLNHFTSNGWKVGGKAAMKSWTAAINNWISRNKNKADNYATSNRASNSQSNSANDIRQPTTTARIW